MAIRSGASWFFAVCVALLAFAPSARAQETPAPLLNSMFQDHAVLQRGGPIPIWGEAAPRARLTVEFNGRRVSARADASGHWRATLPAMEAGGPYTLTVSTRAGARQSVEDVMVGDVFLCSGQSNMEWSLRLAQGAFFDLSRPANPKLRLMSVAHEASVTPRDNFATPVSWSIAGPDTVGTFSAVCYYFARELMKSVDVPIGLIHSSWGGSAIETWIGEDALRALGGYDARLDLLNVYARDQHEGYAQMGAMWQNWWRNAAHDGSEPWNDSGAAGWTPLPEPMRDWKKWGVAETADLNGLVWFRRSVNLTAAQAAQSATLSLGAIDEVDQTWVNGAPVANTFGWSVPRNYDVPAGTFKAGDNLIVVNVLSTWDMGGMYGPPEDMKITFADGTSAPIGGNWTYRVVPRSLGYPPRAPWESIAGLTNLNNAMIAPLGHYAMRGALWYQGESNTGAADIYQGQLSALFADWRSRFGANLPVLVVQLPNFGSAVTSPGENDWASLREAERRAVLADAHAGLAVTIDLGDRDNLHPPNKAPVGARLARVARHVIYGEAITPSGPVPLGARFDNGRVAVTFGDIDGSLVTYSSGEAVGFELCGAGAGTCRFASARVEGARALIDTAGGPTPTRVRFCWGAGPQCNLYDTSGLPAGPFEIAIQ